MIYTAQLHDGEWYILARTNAPDAAMEAINALPCSIFPWNQEAEARAAVSQAMEWVEAEMWRVVATDAKTGAEIILSEGDGCPRARIQSHLPADGKYYGLRAIPIERRSIDLMGAAMSGNPGEWFESMLKGGAR